MKNWDFVVNFQYMETTTSKINEKKPLFIQSPPMHRTVGWTRLYIEIRSPNHNVPVRERDICNLAFAQKDYQ